MNKNPFLRLTTQNDEYIEFEGASGIDASCNEIQHLVFNEGKVFGVGFIKWLANIKTTESRKLAQLMLLFDDDVLYKWELSEMKLARYVLKKSQLTEKYLELECLEIYAVISQIDQSLSGNND